MKYLAMIALLSSMALTACDDGPAENLGEDIDRAATDLGNAVEDACEDLSDQNC